MASLEIIANEGRQAFIGGQNMFSCPYDGPTPERKAWMKGFDDAEREQMNPIMRFFTGDSVLSTIAGCVLFFLGIFILFNGWTFIAELLRIPWDSRGYK